MSKLEFLLPPAAEVCKEVLDILAELGNSLEETYRAKRPLPDGRVLRDNWSNLNMVRESEIENNLEQILYPLLPELNNLDQRTLNCE